APFPEALGATLPRCRSRRVHPSAVPPEHAVQSHQSFTGERFAPFENLAPETRGDPPLLPLLVPPPQHRGPHQLTHLAAVEQIAGTLGGDARVVAEDDRSGEDRLRATVVTDECRPQAFAPAALNLFTEGRRWIDRRDESPGRTP